MKRLDLSSAGRMSFRRGAWAVAAGLFATGVSLAGEGVGAASTALDPITIYRDDASDFRSGGPALQLLRRAQERGEVRVIVGLRIVTRMEHTLSAAQVVGQRRAQRSVEDALIARVFGSASASRVDRFGFIPYISMFVDAQQLRRLLSDPQVVSIHEDVPERLKLGDSVPLIHAPDVFAKGFNGTDQVVAVVDSGVDKKHPMLAGKVVSEACYSTTKAPDMESLCPGGVAESTAPGSGVNCPVDGPGGIGLCEHGTHVASIAAGNSNKFDGVGRDAQVIAIQVGSRDKSDNSLSLTKTDIIKGLKRVLELKDQFQIAAVNFSLGGSRKYTSSTRCDQDEAPRKMAIDNLRAVGIATLVASGNDGFGDGVNAPACISTAIAVGNTTKADLLAKGSNHSPLVKLLAPGSAITAAVPAGTPCITNRGPHCAFTGTSQATPHVSGAFAVLRNVRPKATIEAILEALTCSGKVVDQRFDADFDFLELDPARPRIDLLGAFNHLRFRPGTQRDWLFASKRELSDWTPFRGEWAWSNLGLYESKPIQPGWAASSVANCDAALTVEVRMKRVSAAPFLNGNGVWLKATLNHTDELVSGYFFSYARGRSAFGDFSVASVFKGDGYNLETGQCTGGSCASLCEEDDFPGVVDDGFNTIKVVSRGASHAYYLNGQQVCTFNDATFATGAIMVGASIPQGFDGEVFQVDYVKVKSLDPGAAPSGIDPVMDPAARASQGVASMTLSGTERVGAVHTSSAAD